MQESLPQSLTARQSEVGDLGDVAIPVVHQDDVRRFQVAHDDVVRVAVFEAHGDIGQAAGRTVGEEWRGKGPREQARATQVKIYTRYTRSKSKLTFLLIAASGTHGGPSMLTCVQLRA